MIDSTSETLYDEVTDLYELSPAELVILGEAQRTADLCGELQDVLDGAGVMLDGPTGPRVRPVVAELRQQRVTLARLLVALRIPTDDEGDLTGEDRTQRRGLRGVYGIGGVA